MSTHSFNIEVAKMRSLMERISKPHTNYQAMLCEDAFMEMASRKPRAEINDIIEFIYDNDFPSAKIVGLGYVIKPEIPKSVFPSPENGDFIGQLGDNVHSELRGKLSGLVSNPKWGKIIGGKSKSASFRGDDLGIIAVATYTLQWQDGKKFNEFYKGRMQGEEEIARKWGVNPMLRQQEKEENKERQNGRTFYVGQFRNGTQPIFGGRIGDFKNGEIARYADGSEKLALKHAAGLVKRQGIHYFYQTEDGQYQSIGKDIVNFLTFKLGNKKLAQEVEQEVEEEAMSYELELKKYKGETNKMIKQFPLRQIGFITATIKNSVTGEKEAKARVKKNVDPSEQSKPFSVNGAALYPHLQNLANATETTANDDPRELGDF